MTKFHFDPTLYSPQIVYENKAANDPISDYNLMRSLEVSHHHGYNYAVDFLTPCEATHFFATIFKDVSCVNRFALYHGVYITWIADYLDYIAGLYNDELRLAMYYRSPYFGLRFCRESDSRFLQRLTYPFGNGESLYRTFPPIDERVPPVNKGSKTYYVGYLNNLIRSILSASGQDDVSVLINTLKMLLRSLQIATMIQEALEWYARREIGEKSYTVRRPFSTSTLEGLVSGGTRSLSGLMGLGAKF